MKTLKIRFTFIFITFLTKLLSGQTELNPEDLTPLQNAKMVLLGEQTHYDGAVFDKKVELIKQLHEKYSFNIIVFESGMYDSFKALQLYQSKKENISIYNQSMFSMWTETTAFKELLDYVSQNPEMKILGFDSQEFSFFKEHFIPDLKELLNQNNIEISEEIYTNIEKTLVYRDIDNYILNKKDSLTLYNRFNLVKSQLNKINNKNLESRIISQTFNSVIADFDFALKQAQEEKIHIQNPRDKQMAENMIFLQEQFPNEKIIGWGASYHFANKIDTYEYTEITEDYITKLHALNEKLTSYSHANLEDEIISIKDLQYAIPMGKLLKEHYGQDLYSIGFTSSNGNYLGDGTMEFPILQTPNNSIETQLFENKSGARLIDKKEYPKSNFYTSTLGYLPIYANWSNIYDGIYYIPEMYPPVYRNYDSENETIISGKNNMVEGIVIERKTNEPIPYLDVYYSSNNKSTIANSKGEFSIVKRSNLNDYLIFSSFGYDSDSIQVKKINTAKPLNIKLQKSVKVTYLNEVVIESSKALTANEILKNAQKRIENNYVQTPFNQQFYYKVQNFSNDTLTFNEEAILDTYFKKGNNGTNNPENYIFANTLQIRNTTNNFSEKKLSGIGYLWPVIIRDVVLSKTNVLYRPGSYELKKKDVINFNGKAVYQISFVNTSPGSYSTGYGYPAPTGSNGKIFIDTESFAVLYYEHCVTREEYIPKRSKYKYETFHKIIQTYKEVEGKYFSNLFKVINKTRHYSIADNSYKGTNYRVNYLMSTDIETDQIKIIERPIQNIKQNIKIDLESDYWNSNSFYIEDNDYKYEGCEN